MRAATCSCPLSVCPSLLPKVVLPYPSLSKPIQALLLPSPSLHSRLPHLLLASSWAYAHSEIDSSRWSPRQHCWGSRTWGTATRPFLPCLSRHAIPRKRGNAGLITSRTNTLRPESAGPVDFSARGARLNLFRLCPPPIPARQLLCPTFLPFHPRSRYQAALPVEE